MLSAFGDRLKQAGRVDLKDLDPLTVAARTPEDPEPLPEDLPGPVDEQLRPLRDLALETLIFRQHQERTNDVDGLGWQIVEPPKVRDRRGQAEAGG